ncbi:hypothetical protein ARSQ2_02376 [Arsenophonus endosymbiont of Bemisia tabaci Q2]|nr:hypothetical protein ARSQ2_02376 [Arsenophonus endosymbiont of Bemisia tabaci Q2]
MLLRSSTEFVDYYRKTSHAHKGAEPDFSEARMTTHTKQVRYLHPSSQRELSVMQNIQNGGPLMKLARR